MAVVACSLVWVAWLPKVIKLGDQPFVAVMYLVTSVVLLCCAQQWLQSAKVSLACVVMQVWP